MGQKGCGRLEGRNSSINSPTGIGPRRQSFVSMKRDLLSSLTKGVSIGILSVLPSILFGGMVKKGRVVLTRVPSASETICYWIHVMCQNTKKLFFFRVFRPTNTPQLFKIPIQRLTDGYSDGRRRPFIVDELVLE